MSVSWSTVRARAASAILAGGRGGWMVSGRYEAPEKLVDRIVAVFIAEGVITVCAACGEPFTVPAHQRHVSPDGEIHEACCTECETA